MKSRKSLPQEMTQHLEILSKSHSCFYLNPLNAELNPICHFLALLGARHILRVSRIRVNLSVEENSLPYYWILVMFHIDSIKNSMFSLKKWDGIFTIYIYKQTTIQNVHVII